MRILVLFLLAGVAAVAQLVPTTRDLTDERIHGAALLAPTRVLTWGDRLREWTLPNLDSRILAEGPFGQGACVGAQGDVYIVQGSGLGDLVRLRPPDYKADRLDTQVEMGDCLEATLFNRRGLLMIHRGAQVRFYHGGQSRDIYSIYTPSYQGGLALQDVDGDGRTDIYCGNYWIQSPRKWEHSWRLFAIHLWYEEEQSANLALTVLGPGRIAGAQRNMDPARIAIFERPADPKQQWLPARLPDGVNIRAIALWNGQLLWGENNGAASRLRTTRRVIHEGIPIIAVLPLTAASFVTASPTGLTLWTQNPIIENAHGQLDRDLRPIQRAASAR